MMIRAITLTATLALGAVSCGKSESVASGSAVEPSSEIPDIRLERMWPDVKITRPVFVTHDGVNPERLYVLEQPGRLLAIDRDASATTFDVVLDIREKVHDAHNEEGLLGLAFHPNFAENGHFFVYYSADEPRRGVIARYTMKSGAEPVADAESEVVVLEQAQRWGNHNGCALCFGPDGMLYVSLGDGGAANDPLESGQDLSTMLGAILRIDIDRQDPGLGYAIPDDNPFVGKEGHRGEIWAYGLRNVWRMSFDRKTGDLWAGDVGQNRWEEIDLIVKGGNYGWNAREGAHAFGNKDLSTDDMIDPVIEYGRRQGYSITGGYVYRGSDHPSLDGVYFYADYASGRIWGFRYEDGEARGNREVMRGSRKPVASFGEDMQGEIYVVTFDQLDRRNVRGRVSRIGIR